MADLDRVLPRNERDLILGGASARNMPIEVMLPNAAGQEALKSRLLKAPGGDDDGALVIQVPTHNGSPAVIHPEETVSIFLLVRGLRYGFQTQVRERGMLRLSESTQVPALFLAYPEKVYKLQRRRFFRVRIPSVRPLLVKCVAQSDNGKSSDDGLERFETTAIDISSGGIALRLPTEVREPNVGSRMGLLFRLTGFRRTVKLLGEVRNVRSSEPGGLAIMGLQFVEWDKTIAGRRCVNWITRYVVRRQREDLKRKSGLK